MQANNRKLFLRIISVISLAAGLGALAFTVNLVYKNAALIALLGNLDFVWYVAVSWPRSLLDIFSQPDILSKLSLPGYAYISIPIAAPLLSVILAHNLNRNRLGWFIVCLIFPYVLIILSGKGLFWNYTYKHLGEEQEYDLLFLYQKGFVRARATGQSITQIYGEVENLIDKTLKVIITPGTYFVAKGNYQNMVTRSEYSFTLHPLSARDVSINATCINANLPIPGKDDRFHGVRKVSKNVSRFLKASQHASSMVIQTGVWALTDNYSGHDIKNHLVTRDRYGNTRQAVSDADIAEARRILDSLGISHRL
ncbi:MAG: hypothetical protein GY801_04200 [bacterium]|nr:hypothetical protein [bacterium]